MSKIADPAELLSLSSWTLVVRGESMRFLLKSGDRILVRRASLAELRVGDLAVRISSRRDSPECVVHRLLGRRRRGGMLYAVTKGDANLLLDPLSPETAVIGVVEAARVGGVWLSLGPERRGWLWLVALGAPVHHCLGAIDRVSEATLRAVRLLLPLPRASRDVLLRLLVWRERVKAAVYGFLQTFGVRLTCGAEIAAPPESESARVVFGILDGDQTWSGRILVEGDVVVPSDATLRIEPGTEIVFREDSRWDAPKECRIWKDWPQELTGKCRLLIAGRLFSEGTVPAPITFGGADWAGIHFVTDSWGSSIVHSAVSRSLCAAVTLHDSAQAALKFSIFSDCESGVVLLSRGASASLEDCRVERCLRRGLSSAGGAMAALRVAVSGCGEIGVFGEEAELTLNDCALTDSPVGFAQKGGSARLTRVSVKNAVRAAFEFDGGAHELRGASVVDCGEALNIGDGRLFLEGFETSGCGTGVTQRAGELNWSGGRISGGRLGLESAGFRALVEDVSFQDQSVAACSVSGGALSLRKVRVERSALGISAAGPFDAEDLGLEGCARGVEVSVGPLSWRGGFLRGGGGLALSPGVDARVENVAFEDGSGNPLCFEDSEFVGRGLRVSGWPEGGTIALRSRRLELDDCSFARVSFGLDVSGGSAVLRGLRFDECRERALGAENVRLELRGGTIDGGDVGVAAVKGSTSLEDYALRGQAGPAVFQNGGTLVLAEGVIEGPGTGVRISQGRLEIRGARFDGPRLSIECNGAAVLERVELEGGTGGVRFEGTSFELSGVKLSGARGLELSRGRLVWNSGRLTGGGLLMGPDAEAQLEDIVVENILGHGAELSGGSLAASRCRFSDVSEAGVYVAGGGLAELSDCSLRRLRYGVGAAEGDTRLTDVRITEASVVGFTAGSGSHRLERVAFHGCADRVHAADGARVDVIEAPSTAGGAASKFKRGLRAAVLRTRRLPLLGAAYRAAYSLPVRVFQVWAALDGNVDGLYAHRSWTRRDWDPGLSDVDLLVAARDLSGEAGRRWLESFWIYFLALKRFFPFLGECIVVEPAELSGYAQWGGFRARGFTDQLVPLNGRLPRLQSRSASPKAALEPLGDLAHAYTRLMASALWRPESSQAGRSAARNAALDVMRLSAAAADAGPAELASREATLAVVGPAADVLRAPLEMLAAAESARARAELCAVGLSRLHDDAVRALASWPAGGLSSLRWSAVEAESSSAGDVELRRRRGLVEEYTRACGGALVAGCSDDLYRTCLVLDDGAVSLQTLVGVFERLSRLVSLRGEPATLPIVLTISAWKVWSRLAYLESPTRFLEPGGERGDFLTRAGAPLPGAWQYAWGREFLTPVAAPDALVLDLARESQATLRCVWRYQASQTSPLSSGYIQHYLLGRTMGLRLLIERGIGASFFSLDPLRALYEREFPERAPRLKRLWTFLTENDGPIRWTELYGWVDAELRD